MNFFASDNPVAGIGYDTIASDYDRRGLAAMSDAALVVAVAGIVAVPRSAEIDSFVLHAPLELIARARLLPLVEPGARHQARLRLVSIAAHYETYGEPLATAVPGGSSPAGRALDDLIDAIATGDVDAADEASVRLGNSSIGIRQVVDQLAPAIVAKTSAAAHAPIFLSLATKSGLDSSTVLALLRPLARELARRPDFAIRWVEHLAAPATTTDPGDLLAALGSATNQVPPDNTFIHPTMMQVDETGVAADTLAPVVAATSTEAEHAVLRAAALSMLHDTPVHAPYGWTHCLTIPQAILELLPYLGHDANAGLALAATHVLGFRHALSSNQLPANPQLDVASSSPAEHRHTRITKLATQASGRHDAHIAKYALAVIDASQRDPDWVDTYLTAGERLIDIWDSNGADSADPIDKS